MKVRNAVQIFSQRVAATLQLVSRIDSQKGIGDKLEDTAELLAFFDRLFDSFNGSDKHHEQGKILRCGLSDTSDHFRFWSNEALPLLSKMKFARRSAKDLQLPPSLKNWAFNIHNNKAIWGILRQNGFAYMLPRRFNQDPIENAFGQLRSFGVLNTHPSSTQFVGIFKTLYFKTTVSMYKRSFNCKNDKCSNMFVTLSKLFKSEVVPNECVHYIVNVEVPQEPTESTLYKTLNELAAYYVAGFILKRIGKNFKCASCYSALLGTGNAAQHHALISAREYGGDWAKKVKLLNCFICSTIS